jgi:hypothetical protein
LAAPTRRGTAPILWDRRGAGELVALVLGDELVVREPALMQLGLLLAGLCGGTLALSLLLGDAGALLGHLCAALALACFLAVRGHNLFATFVESLLTASELSALTHPRQCDE